MFALAVGPLQVHKENGQHDWQYLQRVGGRGVGTRNKRHTYHSHIHDVYHLTEIEFLILREQSQCVPVSV
jgi:hypothetical protein